MSDVLHGTPIRTRIMAEHRGLILTLAAALVANVLIFAFFVYPLSQRVANVEERTRAAEQALAAAGQEFALASATLTGKARAASGLSTFYDSVLPQSLSDARRLTYLRLHQLAQQSGLDEGRTTYEAIALRDSTLTRLKIEMDLVGSYADMRTFIHQLESAPEFVVIENMRLAEGVQDGEWLQLRLELSTYYQDTVS